MLSDEQKTRLGEKRAAHLMPSKTAKDDFTPDQPVWYTEDGTPEWKPGYIEMRDALPNSYWIISIETGRRLRRNKYDIKPRYHQTAVQPSEHAEPSTKYRMPPPLRHVDPPEPSANVQQNPAEKPTPTASPSSPQMPASTPKKSAPSTTVTTPVKTPVTTRSGRHSKSTKNPDFVYKLTI